MAIQEPVSALSGVDMNNTEIAFSSKSNKELKQTYRLFRLMNNSGLVNLGSRLTLLAFKFHLPFVNGLVKRSFFEQFCGGEDLLDCQPKIDKLNRFNTLTILDFGAEAKSSEEELKMVTMQIFKAIEFAATNSSIPVISTKLSGLADNSLFEKVQAGQRLDSNENKQYETLKQRLDSICAKASKHDVGIYFDAEESWMQDTMDELVTEMMRKYNTEKAVVHNTIQLYRHDRLKYFQDIYESSRSEGYVLGMKLVRGAYMNRERERAAMKGYPSPIQKDKDATDKDYNAAVHFCVEHYKNLSSCNATHNIGSSLLQAQLIIEKGIQRNHPHLNFSQLYGMADYISYNLSNAGFNVAKYLPYGPVKEVIPYLVRRAQENSSVTGMSRELTFLSRELKRRGI